MKSYQEFQNLDDKQNLLESDIVYIDITKGKIRIKGDDLRLINIWAYGVGHVLNDLTATCWFSFLLYYLTDIVNLSKEKAGWVMLSGQVFDGIATPLVGILSDKYTTSCGKRTPWYIGGTIGVIVCFSLIFQNFNSFFQSTSHPALYEMIYYITLPSLFNVGWAAVQVSHMALLPSISINKKNRDYMVRLRTALTFTSQMVCLLLSFIIFYFISDKFVQYSVLSLLCVLLGTVTSIYFLFFCKEITLNRNIDKYYEEVKKAVNYDSKNKTILKSGRYKDYDTIETNMLTDSYLKKNNCEYGVKYWLSKPLFYKYIVVYMLVRLSINITCSMLPYYLERILDIKKTKYGGTPVQISLIYLLSTSGCLFNSLYMQKFIEKYKSRVIMMLAAWIFTTVGLLPILLLTPENTAPVYFFGFIFGIGFALALSTASSLINDVVGSKGDHGAFVYGAYSLTDKFCCGILLFIFVDYVKDDKILLKYFIPILPVICILLALLIVSYKKKEKRNKRRKWR